MKKFISVAAIVAAVLVSSSAFAMSCDTEFQFKAYVLNPNGSYSLAITTNNANYLISQIAANPSVSGYVRGQDLVCDGYRFWSFANGSWTPAR